MLTLNSISKAYGSKQVLTNISLAVHNGECVAIAGKNSVGKTTLLSICAKKLNRFTGSIALHGKASFMPQDNELLQGLTVLDHLSLWYSAYDKDRKMMFSPQSYEMKLGLQEYQNVTIAKLSGGRARRLSIALALIPEPDLILMDEPFAFLDIVSRQEVAAILMDIKALGKAMLISSHIIGQIPQLWDRVYVLEGGEIIKEINLKSTNITSAQAEELVINCFEQKHL